MRRRRVHADRLAGCRIRVYPYVRVVVCDDNSGIEARNRQENVMLRSEYAANQALQTAVRSAGGWMAPSTCVRRKESAFKRLLKALGVRHG